MEDIVRAVDRVVILTGIIGIMGLILIPRIIRIGKKILFHSAKAHYDH